MDWPIPEFDEKQVREKERKAAESYYPVREFDCVAKMYGKLGETQRAVDCYNLAKRPIKAGRLEGEKAYDIKETFSVYEILESPRWYGWGLSAEAHETEAVNFTAELYATLGDLYLAIVSYLDSGIEPPFQCWRFRNNPPYSQEEMASDPDVWFFKPPQTYPTLGIFAWNPKWTVDLAERDGRSEVAASLQEEIAARFGNYSEKDIDRDYHDCIIMRVEKCLEKGVIPLAVELYDEWIEKIEDSDCPDSGLFFASTLFYTAGDMNRTLEALDEWYKYVKDHPSESKRHIKNIDNLLRLETLALWRLGKIKEAAKCFEGLVRNAADRCDFEKEQGAGGYDLYNYEPDLVALATLRELAGDNSGRNEALNAYELVCRAEGRWVYPVVEYYFRGMLNEMERVCRDEDELDVAAHLYERAGKTDDAARILEEMTGTDPIVIGKEENVDQQDSFEGQTTLGICPGCKSSVSYGDRFCGYCGHLLEKVCSGCGAIVSGDKKFCTNCGTQLN